MILDVEHLGHIDIHKGGSDNTPLRYKATEVHFNGPSEHKLNGHRNDMEM